MAEQPVNKSALVREYLGKHPDKTSSEIAKQITKAEGVEVTTKYVTDIRSKAKLIKAPAPAKAAPATPKPAPAPAKSAPARAEGVARHIANLKAAAQALGKEESKRIIDLF